MILDISFHFGGQNPLFSRLRHLLKSQKLNIDWNAWEWPPIFQLIQTDGNVPTDDMKNSFNLGIGMILIVSHNYIEVAEEYLNAINEPYIILGSIK